MAIGEFNVERGPGGNRGSAAQHAPLIVAHERKPAPQDALVAEPLGELGQRLQPGPASRSGGSESPGSPGNEHADALASADEARSDGNR